MAGRFTLSVDDIREVALPALRHRVLLSFDAERQAISPDEIVKGAIERSAPRGRPVDPVEAAGDQRLIDDEALRELQRLSLPRLDAVLAGLIGQRTGPRGARGLEFADYRPYTPGDDMRRIDWNIYARLRELFVKVSSKRSQHRRSRCLIDGSRSMDEGEPSKFRYAQQLAAMLGTVALLRSDVVQVHMLADGRPRRGPASPRRSWSCRWCRRSRACRGASGPTSPRSIRACRRGGLETDMAVLISDAFVPSEQLAEAVVELAGSARSSALVHVIDHGELDTPLRGPLELRDRETGERLLVDVTPAARERYEAGFELFAERPASCAPAMASHTCGHSRAYDRSICCSRRDGAANWSPSEPAGPRGTTAAADPQDDVGAEADQREQREPGPQRRPAALERGLVACCEDPPARRRGQRSELRLACLPRPVLGRVRDGQLAARGLQAIGDRVAVGALPRVSGQRGHVGAGGGLSEARAAWSCRWAW